MSRFSMKFLLIKVVVSVLLIYVILVINNGPKSCLQRKKNALFTISPVIIYCPILYSKNEVIANFNVRIVYVVFSQSSPDNDVSLTRCLTGIPNNVLAVIPTVLSV